MKRHCSAVWLGVTVQAALVVACGTVVNTYFVSAPRSLPTDVRGRVEQTGRISLELDGLALALEVLNEDLEGGWIWTAFPPAVIPDATSHSVRPDLPLLLAFELTPTTAGFTFDPTMVTLTSDVGRELTPMAFIGPGRRGRYSCLEDGRDPESRQEGRSFSLMPNEPTCFVLAYPASPYRVQEFVLSIGGLQRERRALPIPDLSFEWGEAKDYGGRNAYDVPRALSDIYRGESPSGILDVPQGIWINSIDFSPDGRLLAAATRRPEVLLWDWAMPERLTSLDFPAKRMTTVGFSPAGSLLVAGTEDGRVLMWDWKDRRPMGTLMGHKKRVTSVAFSPDGEVLASGSEDETVILWDLKTRSPSRTFAAHRKGVTSVAFHPQGSMVASASEDHTVRLWDLSTGQSTVLEGHQDTVTSVALHPDGTLLASASQDRTVILWAVETAEMHGAPLGPQHSPVKSVAFDSTGAQLAAASADRIVIWDISSRRPYRLCLRNPEFEPQRGTETVKFHPDGRALVWGTNWHSGIAVCRAEREN